MYVTPLGQSVVVWPVERSPAAVVGGVTCTALWHDDSQGLSLDGKPRRQLADVFAVQLQGRPGRRGHCESFCLKMTGAARFVQSAGDNSPGAGRHSSPGHTRENADIQQAVAQFGLREDGE